MGRELRNGYQRPECNQLTCLRVNVQSVNGEQFNGTSQGVFKARLTTVVPIRWVELSGICTDSSKIQSLIKLRRRY
jgi:hypothetical protein